MFSVILGSSSKVSLLISRFSILWSITVICSEICNFSGFKDILRPQVESVGELTAGKTPTDDGCR
jgi:hypothetical protein